MEQIVISAKGDHILQWIALKEAYVAKRNSDPGRFGKAIPRTTNRDVMELARWWHNEFQRALLQNPFLDDRDKASRKQWEMDKKKIDGQLASADPAALYPENEWFWQSASFGAAHYLEGRKAVPSKTELMLEAVKETIQDRVEDVRKVGAAATGLGERVFSVLKTGALIVGGVVGAAIILPPVIRAFRNTGDK